MNIKWFRFRYESYENESGNTEDKNMCRLFIHDRNSKNARF